MSEVPAVYEISKRYSGQQVRLEQKCTCGTLPRKTNAGEALERACGRSTPKELQDVMC